MSRDSPSVGWREMCDEMGISSDQAEAIRACPECDTSDIYERASQRPRFRCKRCGAEFDTARERAPEYLPDRLRLLGETDER